MAAPQHNQQIAALFRSIADLLATQRANPYRVRAYRRGADALLALEEDVAEIAKRKALEEIEGIGIDLSEKIEEFLRTGRIQTPRSFEDSSAGSSQKLGSITRVSLNPSWRTSIVVFILRTLADLEQLVRSHMLRTIPGFSGSEEALLTAIETLRRQATIKKDGVP